VNDESLCINAVVTRSQSECSPVINQSDSNVSDVCESHDSVVSHISDESFNDVDESNVTIRFIFTIGVTNSKEFAREQLSDTTLPKIWTHARQCKAGYFIKHDILLDR